jgi:hypothetical protein
MSDPEQYEVEKADLDADRSRLLAAYDTYYADIKTLLTEYLAAHREFVKRWRAIARAADKAGKNGSIAYDLEERPMHPSNIGIIEAEDLKDEAKSRKACFDEIERVYTNQLEDLREQYLTD